MPTVQLATWNVLHRVHAENWGEDLSGFPDERERERAIAALIAEQLEGGVRAIALQECSGDQLAVLRAALGDRTRVVSFELPRRPRLRAPGRTVPLADASEHLVIVTAGDPALTLGGEAYASDPGKGLVAADLGGLVFIGTHVTFGERGRAQLARLRQRAAEAGKPVAIGGDFNAGAAAVSAALGAELVIAPFPEGVPTRRGGAGPQRPIDRHAGALPLLSACAAGRARHRSPPPADPAQRALADHLASHFAEVETLRLTRGEAGERIAFALLAEAEALGDKRTLARTLELASRFQQPTNESHERAQRAAALAVEIGDDEVAADAWLGLGFDVGFRENRTVEGRALLALAEAAIKRLGDDLREATRLGHLATIEALVERRLDDARRHLAEKNALRLRVLGAAHPSVLAGDDLDPSILMEMGKLDEALALRRQQRPGLERLYGPEGKPLVVSWINEAVVLLAARRADEALPAIERAFHIQQVNGAPGGTWNTHVQWGRALRLKGDFAGALAQDRTAVEVMNDRERRSVAIAVPLETQGFDLLGLGKAGEAADLLERALVEGTREPGGYEYETAECQFALARALWESGRDRRRAVQLAAQAAAGYRPEAEKYGSYFRTELEEIERWRAEHPGAIASRR